MYGTLQAVATQRRLLLRVAVEGAFIWLVIHAVVAGGNAAAVAAAGQAGGGGLYSGIRAGIVAATGVALWVDLRASRDFLFHANLGLGGRTVMAAGLLPGVVGEIVLHALQLAGG